MELLITNARLVSDGKDWMGALLIRDDRIAAVYQQGDSLPPCPNILNAEGALLLPGVIDDHVHFRDPGLTHKADIAHESRAAAAGGVTTVMDMPNVIPQTTTLPLLHERVERGQRESVVRYACYLGATNDNIDEILHLQPAEVPGVKLFMGSSTGNMLVDDEVALRKIFSQCPTLIMTHCEDTARINQRMAEAKEQWGDDPAVEHHPWIRDEEACYRSSSLAVRLAQETGARLHMAHVTTARELELFTPAPDEGPVPHITAEVCIPHLVFTDADYSRLGTRIKCNPSVKGLHDRNELRKALTDGRIFIIGTDHAPHLLSEKEGGAARAVSGMPMVQFSLVSMLELVDEGILPLARLVQLMCHNPARLFGLADRGYLRPGMLADLVLVRRHAWTLTADDVRSKCGWSPLEGHTFQWQVQCTIVGGKKVAG